VRGSAVLDIGRGGQDGVSSDAFIESVFSVAERTRSMTIVAVFRTR